MSGSALAGALALWAVYGAGWLQGRQAGARIGRPVRPTWCGLALWLAVAIPSLVQFAVPVLLSWGRRDGAAIGSGQVWRVVTSMFLQDGGIVGTAFNLVTLAVTVLVVGALVRGWVMIMVFLTGGALSNVVTVLTVAQAGAGNSMATIVLLVAVATWSVVPRQRADVVRAIVLLALALLLVVLRNPHGIAVVIGLVLGAIAGPARSLKAQGVTDDSTGQRPE